jgi:hypothetical protein
MPGRGRERTLSPVSPVLPALAPTLSVSGIVPHHVDNVVVFAVLAA